ncbi:MAG: hypothetical protein CM15mP107_3940 [Bacteroidota bacterium]|nr:MAG: hypothetical protein CM15mP107_3940 [Bacteroidota bacterium]
MPQMKFLWVHFGTDVPSDGDYTIVFTLQIRIGLHMGSFSPKIALILQFPVVDEIACNYDSEAS